jgi:hypothetical protein
VSRFRFVWLFSLYLLLVWINCPEFALWVSISSESPLYSSWNGRYQIVVWYPKLTKFQNNP